MRQVHGVSRRRLLAGLATVALIAAVGVDLYAKQASAVPQDVIAVAGDVQATEFVVRAPSITQPTPDYTVGLPQTGGAASAKKTGTSGSAQTLSRTPVVAGFLSEVLVAEGTHVSKGETIARLDTTMLDLGVAQADTALAKARADLDALDANASKLDDTRAKLVKSRATLRTTRASLETTIALLQKQRGSLETSVAALQKLVDLPGGPPPHVPPYPVLLQAMKNALAGLTKGLAGARTGLAKIDTGLAAMRKGLSKLDTGRQQLRDVRSVLAASLAGTKAAARTAVARRDAATITSPVDGVVTFARVPGTAVMVNAPLVRIRPDGPCRIDTYLTADQLERVAIGSAATVGFDSNPTGGLAGRITTIDDYAVVPPTSFPTSIVHMSRAVRVTITLDGDATAPPGTPVDIEIETDHSR